jgi:hypothetical protein
MRRIWTLDIMGRGHSKGTGNDNEEATAPFICLRSHCPTLAHGIIGRRMSYEKCLIRSIGHPESWLLMGKVRQVVVL